MYLLKKIPECTIKILGMHNLVFGQMETLLFCPLRSCNIASEISSTTQFSSMTNHKITRVSSTAGFLSIFFIGGNKVLIAGNFVTCTHAGCVVAVQAPIGVQGQHPGGGPGGKVPRGSWIFSKLKDVWAALSAPFPADCGYCCQLTKCYEFLSFV